MYKIETHCHTPVISACGKIAPEEAVAQYKAAGYDAITVTDHYSLSNFFTKNICVEGPGDKLSAFLEGYRQMRDAARGQGLRVYYGAELRFLENNNDYLLYGFSPELLAEPQKVCSMSVVDFISLAREDGALLIQAHPFRRGCVPVPPDYLDGMEIANRHGGHDNRNHLAAAYAERHGLLCIGGTDFHNDKTPCTGGILAEVLPEDSRQLAQLLKSGNYTIL